MLRAVAEAAKASRADEVVVVLPPEAAARREALAGLEVGIVEAADWAEGMAASLRAGVAAVAARADAVVVLLADMPEVGARRDRPADRGLRPGGGARDLPGGQRRGRAGASGAVRAALLRDAGRALTGDRGAREVLAEAAEFVTEVPTAGRAALVDLDTPEDWAAWRAGGG